MSSVADVNSVSISLQKIIKSEVSRVCAVCVCVCVCG